MSTASRDLPGFTLNVRLGTDGVAEAFTATHGESTPALVRRVLPRVLADAGMMAELDARVADLRTVSHPSLASILDDVSDGTDRHLVESWPGGADLNQVIAACRRGERTLSPALVLYVAIQVANALAALHATPAPTSGRDEVLHLALNPHAVHIAADGQVCLGAYGLLRDPFPVASAVPFGPGADQIAPRMDYLAPEQTRADGECGPASDIFSLGVLLYELLTLRSLFSDETYLQTIHRVRRADTTDALVRVSRILPGLEDLLGRMLASNPRRRPSAALTVREELKALLGGYPLAALRAELGAMVEEIGARSAVSAASDLPLVETGARLRAAIETRERPRVVAPEEEDTSDEPTNHDAPTPAVHQRNTLPQLARGNTLVPAEDPLTEEAPLDARIEETHISDAPPPIAPPAMLDEGESTPRPHDYRGPPTVLAGGGRTETPSRERVHVPEPTLGRITPPPAPPVVLADVHIEPLVDERESDPPLAMLLLMVAVFLLASLAGARAIYGRPDAPSERVVALTSSPAQVEAPAQVAEPVPVDEPEEDLPEVVAMVEDDTPEEVVQVPVIAPAPAPVAPPPKRVATAEHTPPASARRTTAPTPRTTPTSGSRTRADATPAARTTPATTVTRTPPPPTATLQASVEAERPVRATPSTVERAGDRNIDALSARGLRGELSSEDHALLEAIPVDDPAFTRARVALYQDARARGDVRARKRHIDALMAVPENRLDPMFLVEQAELAVLSRDWDLALERARLAQLHWSRLPSEVMFDRRAKIFEAEASAWQGLFVESGGNNIDALDEAIRAWQRYQEHVATRSRQDLVQRADAKLSRLYDAQRRIQ